MSAKFKPQKKAAAVAVDDDVVDDWDASEPEEETILVEEQPAASASSSKAAVKPRSRDAWDDTELDNEARVAASGSSTSGRAIWEDANKSAPAAQPVLLGPMRTLPIMAPRISAASAAGSGSPASSMPGTGIPGDEYDARPPPQILRREKPKEGSNSNANAGHAPKKTLAEREDEYRRARERIFGAAGTSSGSEGPSTDQPQKQAAGGRRSGHSTPGSGRSSPAVRQPRS